MIPQVPHRLPQILLRAGAEDLRAGALHFRSLGAEHDAPTPDTVFGAAEGKADVYGLSVKADGGQIMDDRIGRSSWCVSGRLCRHADPGAGLKQHYKWLGVTQYSKTVRRASYVVGRLPRTTHHARLLSAPAWG